MPKQTEQIVASVQTNLQSLGVRGQPAKVVAARGKYYVQVGKKKIEVQPDQFHSTQAPVPTRSLVGKPVAAVLYKGSIVALVPIKRPPLICYVPRPDLLKAVLPEVSAALLDKYVALKVITREFARTFAR